MEFAGSVQKVVTWPFDGIDVASTFGTSGWWLNIVLFVPLGFCIRGLLRDRGMWWSAAAVAGAAFLVESGQAFTGFRSADTADLVANFVGGMAGRFLLSTVRVARTRLPTWAGGVPLRWIAATTAAALIVSRCLPTSWSSDIETKRDDVLAIGKRSADTPHGRANPPPRFTKPADRPIHSGAKGPCRSLRADQRRG